MTPPRPSPAAAGGAATAAAVLVLAACALMGGTTLIAKMLGPIAAGDAALHPMQVTAGRFVFGLLTLLPVVAWLRVGFEGTSWINHALRMAFAWAGITCLFAAAANMRLADATAIGFLNPIVAMLLSIPLLGERVGPWRWAGAAVAFSGAAVLAQPGTDAFQPVALIALLAALFIGIEVVLIKRLADREPALRILFLSNLLGMLISLCVVFFVWRWPTVGQWGLLAALGAMMAAAQALFVQAMRRGDASFVTPFMYSTLLFAALYDYVAFGVLPTAAGWAGAALIVCGALLVAWRERMRRRMQ